MKNFQSKRRFLVSIYDQFFSISGVVMFIKEFVFVNIITNLSYKNGTLFQKNKSAIQVNL